MVENVVLNLLLIPEFSLNGAAAVTTATELTQVVVFTAFALRLTGPVSVRRILAGPAAGVAAMAAVALALPAELPALALGLVLYAVVVAGSERAPVPRRPRAPDGGAARAPAARVGWPPCRRSTRR